MLPVGTDAIAAVRLTENTPPSRLCPQWPPPEHTPHSQPQGSHFHFTGLCWPGTVPRASPAPHHPILSPVSCFLALTITWQSIESFIFRLLYVWVFVLLSASCSATEIFVEWIKEASWIQSPRNGDKVLLAIWPSISAKTLKFTRYFYTLHLFHSSWSSGEGL